MTFQRLSKVTSNPQYPNCWVSRNNLQLINISEARALRWVSDWVKHQKLVIEFFLYQDIPAKNPQPKQQQKNPKWITFAGFFTFCLPTFYMRYSPYANC